MNLKWIAEFNDVETRFLTKEELAVYVAGLEAKEVGHLAVLIDEGPRSRWETFLFGLSERIVVSCFYLEWSGAYASLTFHDDASSEYLAIDHEHPVHPTEDQRRNIAHGEYLPPPEDECLDKARAFKAIRDFLDRGTRPEWLSYRYVP